MFAPVYLDHNATTPVDPAVLAGMLPWLERQYGNPSSRHEYGRAARQAIDEARERVAQAVNAHPTEVIFTSGGSESNNLFIKGAAHRLKPACIAVSAGEHPCVLRPAQQLSRQGWQLRSIKLDSNGQVDWVDFSEALTLKPRLISIMMANNETGVIHPVDKLADQSIGQGAWFHTDAVQAFGKLPLDFRQLNSSGVHAMTVSAHKIYGPKGVGALIIDKRLDIEPLIAGGGHERGLRSGTENVPAIVGFGLAAELAAARLGSQTTRQQNLRNRLELGLIGLGATIFAVDTPRLPNTTYFAFPEIDGETLVGKLDRAGFAIASGAACSSTSPEPSHVLRAMNVAPEIARGAVRVSIGNSNHTDEIDLFLTTLQRTLSALRGLTALAA